MKTIINIKADKETKKKAQELANELGFSLSSIVNASLKQFIRSREVYFSIVPKMTSKLENILGKIEKDIKKRKNISRVFSSAEDAIDYLYS